MRDDMETNINFITMVQDNPCLYDHTRPDYSNRNKQDKIWAQIAEQFNESVTTCRERWKNIRGRYVKQLKTSPSGSGAKPKKPYYLAEYLSFLDTFIKSRPPSGNLQSPPSVCDNAHELSDADEESLTGLRDITETFRPPTQSSLHTDTSGPSTPEPGTSSLGRLRNKKGASLNDLNSTVINYFETKKKRLCEKADNSASIVVDPDLSFLHSILPDMKQMNESQKRNFKIGILHLTGQILNQPVITPSLPRPSATTSSTLTELNNNDNEQAESQWKELPRPSVTTSSTSTILNDNEKEQAGRRWNEPFLLPQYTPINQCTDSAVIPNSLDLYQL